MKKQGLLNNEEKAASRAKNLFAAEGWVEHLEDEMEPMTFDQDLDLLLKNSEEDRALFESLKKTREAVKRADDVALPESGHYYDNLHSKIMAAIEQEEIDGRGIERHARKVVAKSRRSFAWTQVMGAVGMTMMLALVALMSLKSGNVGTTNSQVASNTSAAQQEPSDQNFERRLAMVDPRVGAQVAHEMGGYESEEDFLTETAAARLKQISAGEARALLYRLGH